MGLPKNDVYLGMTKEGARGTILALSEMSEGEKRISVENSKIKHLSLRLFSLPGTNVSAI